MEYRKFENHLKNTLNSREEAVDVSKIMSAVIASEKKNYKAIFIILGVFSLIGVSSYFFGYSENETISNAIELQQNNYTNTESDFKARLGNEIPQENIKKENNLIKESIKVNSFLTPSNQENNRNLEDSFIQTEDSNTPFHNEHFIPETINKIFESAEVLEESVVEISLNEIIGNELNNNVSFERSSVQRNSLTNHSLLRITNNTLLRTKENYNFAVPNLVECPKFRKNPWIFEIGTIMGVSNPVKRFSINPNEINPALTSRAENEKSLEGLDLELYLSAKRTRWPVFIKSGVAYSRWTERIDLNRNFTEIDTVQGVISATVSPDGDTLTFIYGDIFIEKDIQINRRVHYYINRVSIPISLVYEGEFNKTNSYLVELGASFNVSTFSAGSIYSNEQTFTNVNAGEFFRTLTGVSYFTKLHYRRYITDKIFIGALGHFHYLPAEFSRSNAFSQKYINYGLNLYAGYRF